MIRFILSKKKKTKIHDFAYDYTHSQKYPEYKKVKNNGRGKHNNNINKSRKGFVREWRNPNNRWRSI
jgi:hypothetical protein